MACSIIRTGEVTTVFDEGGNVSTLFQEAMDEFNDVEQALDVFYTSRSQEFSENSGVFYRDATLNDVLRFYTNYGVSSSSVHVFSPKETIEVIDAMKNMGIKSIYELNEVMQDLFHNADGVFEIDAEKLVKSGYYTMEEVLALESSDIIHTLNKLSKFVLTGFDVVVSDAEYSGYKNTTVQKNMFGAYPFISSLEVKQYIAENGLDSLEGTPYSFVLDNSLEGVSGKQRVKTKRKVKDITREDTVERLSKTSLANRVHILSSEGIRGVLDRIGFSEELKNQVISYRGIRKALDVLNTKTNHRDYGELMNGIYFGELPVALAFAGYNVFSPGLEEHSQLFKAKIDDSKFVTIDMKGHTPGSDENFIKIVGEERYLKLLEQKRSGEITGMKLINAPEFLHGEEKQVQYVVFDRELIELTASFRGKALQDLGAMTLRLSTEGVQLTPNGFVYRGDVYLNNDVYETETAVHEFSHLYLDRLKEVNPFLYERGIELIKTEGFEYITHVRRTQPNLVGERLYEEALAQAVGEEGAKIIDEGKRNKFLSFIRDLWESIKSSLGLSGMTYDQASKLNLKEYSRAIAIDLLSGEPLNNLGNKTDSLNLNSVEFSFLEQSELDSQGNIRPEVARAIREERIRIENEARGNQINATEQELQQIKAQAIADGTFMKAPNGEDTNLTERQWLQVRSKAFIDWFGDWINDPENASKVVDVNGEPMVVYHALKTDDSESITVFDRDKSYRPSYNNLSRGTYFSSNIEDIQKGFNNRRNKIQQVFLNLRSSNSFEIDFNGKTPGDDQYSFLPILGSTMYNMVSKAVNNGELGGLILNDAKEVTHLDYKNNQYVIYDGNVIKSATDNVGTFSSESNNINFQITEEQGSRNLDQESKAFNEGVEAVAKLADEYKKEFGIDSVRHNKVGKLFPAVSRMISEAYEQAETGMTSEEVREAYKALEEETLQQYKFIVDKGLKVSRWTGEGEPYPNSKSMLKDVRENNHLYFLPNSEAFGKEGDEVEGRAGLKLTDVYLDDGYRMTLSEVFRVVHDYFGHGILGNQFGAVGEENATLQHLDLYSFKALPAVIFQTRGQNSWVNFSGVNDEALRKIREGSRTNNKSLLEEGQKEFRFATPKDNILPKIFNFKTYETARRINEQEEIRKSETYLDPRGTHEDTNISELLTRHTLRNSGKLNGFRRRSLGVSKRVGGYDVDVIAEYEGNKEVDKLIKDVFPRFKGTQKIYEITNGEVYRELMIEALETNKFKSSVTVHSAEDFSNMRLFVTEDGSTGITLTKDGFLGGAFGNPKANRPNNLAQMMLLGIKEGALTAEAFDTVLPNYYSLFGFKAVSRTAFNDEYRPLKENGALEDWDYELYSKFNNGRPDVVFFIYDGGDRGSIQSRLGQFDSYSNYQKDFTEYYDKDSYDDAYRFMEVEAINKSNYQNQEVDFQINERGQELQQIREQAIARGTFMKAPNGKPSNLSEEQWITVRTERFKAWFGDWENDPQNASKVVDENGEPLVVYHGTEKAFTEFKSEKTAQGVFWFSEDKGKIERGESGAESVSEIMPVFLNIRDIAGWNEYENKSIDELERDGFEGVKLDDDYIAFNPNQIKSATDNIGTFNVKNNEIRFSISNSNTNFTEDETTRYYTDSQGKRIPFKRYAPDDDGTKSNLLQQEEGQGLGESTDFALVERQFIEDKNLNFTSGTRIESLNDVAWLFRSLENEAVENVFVVYIDEEGGYTVQHLGQGGITAAVIDSRLVVGNAVKYGAKSIAFVHNHPSGSLKASRADMTVFSRLRKGLEGTGVELLDGVIINLKTGKYVTFDENSQVVEEVTEQNQEQHKVQVLSFSKQIFSENYNPVKIGGSRDVAELITTKRFGVSDKTEMLVLNNSNEVVGKFVLPEENQYAKITELLSQYGGASVILYGNKIDPSQIKDYNRRLEQIGATILDAIEVKSDNYTSLRDEGILYEPQREYGVSPQENKTLQEAEEQEQLKRLNLEKLNEISEEYEQGNRIFKRLPQREQSGFTRIGRTGIEAAIHLDAVFGANENGAANKAEQERALKEYAKRSNVWVEDIVQQRGEPHTEGQEALVWFNEDTNIVTKSILPLEQTPQEFLDRVSIHNSIFPETQIKVIGFTETKSGELQYIVEQPLVVFERGATQAEVSEMMSKLGFEHTGENDYANNETLIEDLHPGNALIDINTRRVAVIDAIIRLNTKEAGYGGERIVGTNNVSELEKSLAEEEVRQQEVEQENIFKRDVLNILVKNNLISNDTFLQLSSLESFNVENVSSILRNNEEAFEGMSDRSIGKKLMSITPVNFEHIFNKWGESFSNEYVEDYVDSLIRNNVVEMRDEDNNICASHGLFFNGVKFGGKWKVVKDLKGKPSHKRGGVDIQLTEKGVKVAKGGTEIIAEKGLVFSSRFDVSDKGLRGGSKWFIEKDLKGYRSHNKGGVDIQLTDNGVYLRREGSPEIIAEKGVLILNK